MLCLLVLESLKISVFQNISKGRHRKKISVFIGRTTKVQVQPLLPLDLRVHIFSSILFPFMKINCFLLSGLEKAVIKTPNCCGQERNFYHPVRQKLFFGGHWHFFIFFFIIFDMHIAIDSEWSKTYDLREKFQDNLKSFRYIFLRFRTSASFLR